MSIDAFWPMQVMLGQASRPATSPAPADMLMWPVLAIVAMGLPLTIQVIRRRQLGRGLLTPQPLLGTPRDSQASVPGQPSGDELPKTLPTTLSPQTDVIGLGAALMLGFGLLMTVSGVVFQLLGGTSLGERTPESQRLVVLVQPAGQIATILGALGMLTITLPAGVRAIHLMWDRPGRDFRAGLSGYLLAMPWVILVSLAVEVLVLILRSKTSMEHQIFEIWRSQGDGVTGTKLLMFLGAVILAPIAEEILFRGLLQTLLLRIVRIPLAAILLASVAFAAIHSPWPMRPPIFVLAVALGWTYTRTGSLLSCIFMHMIFNAMQFAFFVTIS